MDDFQRRLVLACSICGLAATVLYTLVAAAPLPHRLAVLFFFAFGPLISVGSIGLATYINARGKMVSAYLAGVFGTVAGVLVNLMAVVQMSNREYFQRYIGEAADPQQEQRLREMLKGVFTVQLGIDVSWDIFICVATILFGYALLRTPGVERWLGALGILAGGLLLGLNLYTFPVPPGEADLVDLGPAVGLWFMVVSIRVLVVTLRTPPRAAGAGV